MAVRILPPQPSSGCGRHVKYYHFEFQTALIVSAPAFFTRPDYSSVPSFLSARFGLAQFAPSKKRGRSAAWRVRPSSPPCGGKHLTALQHGDFGPRGRNFRPIGYPSVSLSPPQLSTGLTPPPDRTSSLLQGGGSYCPRTAYLGPPGPVVTSHGSGRRSPAPHASTSADMPLRGTRRYGI